MEKINNLIVALLAIANFAKDIHYNCKGDAFYSKHLLADRIQSDLYGYIDDIKEVFFLAIGNGLKESKQYLTEAAALIPDITGSDKADFISLKTLILQTLNDIEKINNLTKGEENLIGAIAQSLQQSLGLLNQQIKE